MPTPDTIRFLIVLLPIILFIMGIRRPVYWAVAYMIIVYGKTAHYYPAFSQFRVELVLPIIILARLMLDPENVKRIFFGYNRVNTYFFLFILSIGMSYMVAWDQEHSWNRFIYHFVQTAFFYFMVIMTLDNEKNLKLFVWSFVIVFMYFSYEPVYGFITKTGAIVEMYGEVYVTEVGLFSGHVALANNMNQMIPISLFLVFSLERKYQKLLAAIPLAFFFIGLIGAASRGGVLGFLFFGLVLVFFSKQKIKIGLAIGILTLAIFFFSTTFVSTLQRVDMDQTHGRFSGLHHGINFVRFGNLLGVGPGCFAQARGYYHGHTMESHNVFGQVIGELGIPGTIIWSLLIWQIFKNLANSKRMLRSMAMEQNYYFYLATGLQISLIVRLFVSMGSHGLEYFYWYILAAISAAIYVQVKRMADENTTNQSMTQV